jgi:hypothetical protein
MWLAMVKSINIHPAHDKNAANVSKIHNLRTDIFEKLFVENTSLEVAVRICSEVMTKNWETLLL